ncbi:hypothetical protein D3C86_1243940 [compost metagenome]
MSARDQQRDAALVQLALEFVQGLDRIGVGLRHGLGVQHEPADVLGCLRDHLARAPAEGVGVEEPYRRLEQPHHGARHRLGIRIQVQLAQYRFTGYPAQQRVARVARHVHGVEQGRAHRHGHALQHAKSHHSHRREYPECQFDPGDSGQPQEGVAVEQAGRGQQQDGRQRGLRQPVQRLAQQAHHDGQRGGRADADQRRRTAGHQPHRRTRIRARHHVALEQAGRHVGRAETHQFAVGVHMLARARGKAARGHDAAGKAHHQHARGAQQDAIHAFQAQRQAQRGQAGRHLAHDRDAQRRKIEYP